MKHTVSRNLYILLFALLIVTVLLLLMPIYTQAPAAARPQLIISEFMAINEHTLTDSDGEYTDWIELYNRGDAAINLDGWYLSDVPGELTRWQFPPVTLKANEYLVVFASGKDRAHAHTELHTNFKLAKDRKYLALVEPDGLTIAWQYAPALGTGYPTQFQDVSYGLVAGTKARYLTVATPGRANDTEPANSGPILRQVAHTPVLPAMDDSLLVTALVQETLAPIDRVTMHCRVMYGPIISVPMADDDMHQDHKANDGMYVATIPSGIYHPGEMVRYYVTATDKNGRVSRWPLFQNPEQSAEYLGTVIADPSVSSELPLLYWFVSDPGAVETDAGTRSSVFYNGTFYDNIFVRLRGLTSRFWPKKSFKFDFYSGHHFQLAPDQVPVEELNLNSTITDKAYIRQILAWETYRDAGAPHAISFAMRVQQNGTFYGVFIAIEQPDERYLERLGLDPAGALYKINLFNTLNSSTESVSKRTRKEEDHSDLQALIDGLNLPAEERTRYLFDHVNVPEVINYMAAAAIIHDRDQGHNNYFMYRDTNGSQEWMILPWDKDLTFGRAYLPEQSGTFNDIVWADRDPESHPLSCYYVGNRLMDAIVNTPIIQEMYLRRLRTLMDQLLQPPDTPPARLHYERRIDQLYAQMEADIALDAARWPVSWGQPETFAQAIQRIKTEYLAARRIHLYETHGPAKDGPIPAAQPANVSVTLGTLECDPASGSQGQEYLTLVNTNSDAVDISGWQIAGEVEYVFQPGTVIPAGRTLYVSPDVAAFRHRDTSPSGNEGLFVQGNYRGRLSNTWGILRLYDTDGRLVDIKIYFNPD